MVSVALVGGSGFIGSNLARYLVAREGYEVRSYDLNDHKLRLRFENEDYRFEQLDVRNAACELDQVVAAADIVVNLAAHVRPGMFLLKPLDVVDVNFFPSLSIV
ncbi:MAG: NAD-dependent epimerase/dehydratase family protein, partial [Bauldia sp.]